MVYLKNEYDERDGGLLFSIFIGAMLAAVFLLQLILAPFGSFSETEAGTWLAQSFLYIVLLGAIIVYHSVKKINPVKALGLNKKFSIVDIIMSVVLGAGMLFAFLILTFFWSYFLQEIGYKDDGGFPAINNAGTFILSVIVMCVLPAVTEETVFRGAVLKGYSKVFGVAGAVIFSTLFFLLMHMNPMQVVNPILTGVVMAVLVHKTKTVKIGMIAHFTNNFIIVLISYIESFYASAEQSSEIVLDIKTLTPYLIYFAVGVVLLSGAVIYFFMKKRGAKDDSDEAVKINPVGPDAKVSIKQRRKAAILFALFGIIVAVLEIVLRIVL